MTCGYCQFVNTEDDHRCGRCGRRLAATVTPAPAHLAQEHVRLAVQALGANALAAVAVPVPEAVRPLADARRARPRSNEISLDAAATLDNIARPRGPRPSQPSLFGAELQPKIIPFKTIYRAAVEDDAEDGAEDGAIGGRGAENLHGTQVPGTAGGKAVRGRAAARSRGKHAQAGTDSQAALDFLPPLKSVPRNMKTNVEAVIFCEAAVASPLHRATAAALDLGMILAAFGSILLVFQTWAHPVSLDRNAFLLLGALLALVAFFYGLLFTIAGAVTPGMQWTHLRLINFDGFPLDGRTRLVRFVGSWISVLSGGLGILWALLDEEHLSWHDHMSKSFPTLRESDSIVARQR